MRRDNGHWDWWTPIAAGVIGFAIAALLVGLWAGGLLKFKGNEETAVLVLVGTFLTGAVSFTGLAINHQGERRLEQGAEQTQRRLLLDSGIEAAKLLHREDGSPADPPTTAAALEMLADLGQLEFAIALLRELWQGDKARVSDDTAVLLIDKALECGTNGTQEGAADLLLREIGRFAPTEDPYNWPIAIPWYTTLPLNAKFSLVFAWVQLWMGARRIGRGDDYSTKIVGNIFEWLYMVYYMESPSRFRKSSRFHASVGELLQLANDEQLWSGTFPLRVGVGEDEVAVTRKQLEKAVGKIDPRQGYWVLTRLSTPLREWMTELGHRNRSPEQVGGESASIQWEHLDHP